MDLFGEVIYGYTRAQALDDGALVDVSETAREAGFTVPVALTRGAWEDLVAWDSDTEQAYQDESGRLWDVLWMARLGASRASAESIARFDLIRIPPGEVTAKPAHAYLHIGPGDHAEPVITIMLDGEY